MLVASSGPSTALPGAGCGPRPAHQHDGDHDAEHKTDRGTHDIHDVRHALSGIDQEQIPRAVRTIRAARIPEQRSDQMADQNECVGGGDDDTLETRPQPTARECQHGVQTHG
jgi:hypothetical protein